MKSSDKDGETAFEDDRAVSFKSCLDGTDMVCSDALTGVDAGLPLVGDVSWKMWAILVLCPGVRVARGVKRILRAR